MSDERTWLRHPDTGGTFHCPAPALPEWVGLGWQPCDAPEEHNPVVAELIAAQAAAREAAAIAAAASKPATPSMSRKSGTSDSAQED